MRFKVRFLLGWYNLSTFARNGLKSKGNRLKSKVMAIIQYLYEKTYSTRIYRPC